MASFDFRRLEKAAIKDLANLNQYFLDLMTYLKATLELDPLYSKILLVWEENDKTPPPITEVDANIFHFGIRRIVEQNSLTLVLSASYLHFLPFILLREAYYCFIPSNMISNKEIGILINHIIEEQLHDSEQISAWSTLIQKAVIDYEYLSAELDKFKTLIKIQRKPTYHNIIRFIVEFIRNNRWLLESSNTENIHDHLIKTLVAQSSPLFFNDERIETLRMLILIFYRLKKFNSLSDFLQCFQDLLVKEPHTTNLTVWKFESNARLISKVTQIAPSYQINYAALDSVAGVFYIRFNPYLTKMQIQSILQYFPFLTGIRTSESNFAQEMVAYLVIPQKYLEDLKELLHKLQTNGYAIKALFTEYSEVYNSLNLNYFREFYIPGRLMNPFHKSYDKNYELEFHFTHQKGKNPPISMLKYLILNRLPYYAADGFGFDRDTNKLAIIKLDLLHELISQRKLIDRLKKYLTIISSHPDLKNQFIQLLKSNRSYGFFYLLEFSKNLVFLIKQLIPLLKNHDGIKSLSQIQETLKNMGKSRTFTGTLFLNQEELLHYVARIFPSFMLEHKDPTLTLKETAQLWYELFNLFDQLKLYEINSIIRILEEKDLASQLFSIKESKLKSIIQEYKRKKISMKEIESLMDAWIQSEPPMISPLVLTSINTTFFAKYHLVLWLKSSPEIMPILQSLKPYCARLVVSSHTQYTVVQIFLPNIASAEKAQFVSILNKLFQNNMVHLQRYFFSGYLKTPSFKEYYDVERERAFYTKDLFPQYYLYLQKVCGTELPVFQEDASIDSFLLQGSKEPPPLDTLVQRIEKRLFRELNSLQRKDIVELERFHLQLNHILADKDKYNTETQQAYFSSYMKSIRFIPNLPHFGLCQYFLYIRPRTVQKFEFKLVFGNTFTKIKRTLTIDSVPTLWIESIFPYHHPNTSYLNWAALSGKLISEYCLFTLKKVHVVFHSHYNFSSQGWDYNAQRFNAYAQKILSEPYFSPPNYAIKKYNVDSYKPENVVGPDDPFFQDFAQLYGYKSFDLKSLFTLKSADPQKIISLIEQQVIYPYFTLKNAGFQEKIILLMPSVKKEYLEPLIKIFSFFNYGFISEIEGELFLYGYPKPVKFEYGLMIQLYMPHCELSEFQTVFADLFSHFSIPKYMILHDLVEATDFLALVFGSLDSLKEYHPLKNLIWDPEAKVWRNPKLFGKKFEKKYPSLVPP